MASDTQILKGLLEGCIIKIVKENETYGYEICEKLVNYGFRDITEGSVYPILIRLEKKKLIYSVMKNSPFGPKRKYYYLTGAGEEELQKFTTSWSEVKRNVDRVLGGNYG
ncbi:PadR family transcriptional regulator [Clostridium tagluense]|uniref:PadR family transcriptional regulator n=1 Tax=Clostridium tagluense TaxID=360422 RepID=UPI001CF22735|nr:PadR family transcriptional regulator [Clostridium tagluense]MCB2299168.1 PadR family transcriptional regulator [Clostridium tagluense]